MKRADTAVRTVFGTAPKLQRMMQYWAATALLYLICAMLLVLQVAAGITAPGKAIPLVLYSVAGALCF